MIFIRPASPSDASNIQRVHRDSIENLASAYYSPEVIRSWTHGQGTPERIQSHERAIELGNERVLLAEVDGHLAGFGAFDPARSELRAVYVSHLFARRGVGHKLLTAVEADARGLGLTKLSMDASLSAEAFYRSHGYIEVERKKHRLGDGSLMDCIAMIKHLV